MATPSIIYLNTLKSNGKYSWADLSSGTGIPQSTIRDIFSGKTACPSFETLSKLIIYMGGDMSAIVDAQPTEEGDSMTAIIAALTATYESYIASLKHEKRVWTVFALVLSAFVLAVLLWDITHGGMGYIRY